MKWKFILWLDTETFSEIPISRGTDVYARPVEIMIAGYAIGQGAVKVHDCTDAWFLPAELEERLRDPETLIVCHNAYFDRTVIRWAWGIDIPASRFWCTMAQAYAHSLPGGLGLLAEVLAVKVRKQDGGKELINLFCKPMQKRSKLRRATRDTHPEQWARFMAYCGDDVGAMRDCFYAMPNRNYQGEEKRLWNLDQKINDTGLYMDTEFAEAAVDLLKEAKAQNDARVNELTNGAVTAATQRDKFLRHLLMEHGVILDSLQADDLEKFLEQDWLPVEVKELIQLRILSAMNSTAKYSRLLNCVGPDGRLRGTRQFNGASRTGRSAGRIFNPYNLRRPTMKARDIELCIDMIRRRDVADIDLVADNLREACSNALRGLVISPPGKKLVISDWSNIEGRDAAWLVGEEWKLDAFRAFDTILRDENGNVLRDNKGKPLRAGPDLYKLAYSKAFNVPIHEVTDFQRQIGKGMELSMQYGGGVGAFIAVSYSYGLDLDELARVIPTVAPWEVYAQANAKWEWALKKGLDLGLRREVWVACETVKLLWRQANPNFEKGWDALETAFRLALENPGQTFDACRCTFKFEADYVTVKLPSGRHLMYPTPRVTGDALTYAGQKHKRWARIKTYGGKLLENITQASSRDVLTESMLRVDDEWGDKGVTIVLDVYDEIMTEVEETSTFGLAELNAILTSNPSWAVGLPLAAEGFEAHRYAKH